MNIYLFSYLKTFVYNIDTKAQPLKFLVAAMCVYGGLYVFVCVWSISMANNEIKSKINAGENFAMN